MSQLPTGGTRADRGFQPEIQGLRTVAVALVVLYHFWPMHLTGGFVGVDVFFVISGYLITAHLYREIARDGHVDLGRFWARRIRRLLPLSFLVLLATSVAAVLLLPATIWQTTFRQVVGSAFYVQNWLLASDAVDYSAMEDSATAVQHFWSLSVEEQFYVAWPLLLFVVYWSVARRRRPTPGQLRRLMISVLLLLGLLSFVFSAVFTAYDPAQAYFVTPTRIWEFVVGAVAALGLMGRQYRGTLGNLVGWAGLAAIVGSAVLYSSATPFPGSAALLPVLGTAAVLVGGGTGRFTGVHWWLSTRPAKFGGDISYAVYLWHWPIVVIAPFVAASAETWQVKVLLIAGIVLVSWASKMAVEDPWRRSGLLATRRRTYVLTAAGMSVVTVVALVLPAGVSTLRHGEAVSTSSECYGYFALANPGDCAPVEGEDAPNPAVEIVAAQAKERPFPDCQAGIGEEGLPDCRLGADPGEAERVMAVFGDSHATQWLPALDKIARDHGIALKVFTRGGCTPNVASLVTEATGRDLDSVEQCAASNRAVVEEIASDARIDAVVVAASQIDREYENAGGQDFADPNTEGLTAPWRAWAETGKDVVVMGEIPRLEQDDVDVPTCVAQNPENPRVCALPEAEVFPWTRNLSEAAAGTVQPGIHYLETKDFFCREETCYAVIGGIVTYYDRSHVSETYAVNLAPEIERRLAEFGVL